MYNNKSAIIIGAGPAGLTAAFELQASESGITPIVLEASDAIGGISQTINFKGNRIDIGGHRFFSKSDRVMEWWHNILPIERTPQSETFTLKYQGKRRQLHGGDGADPELTDDVMLVRSRLSRIYYGGKFYNYPVTLEWSTIKNLGLLRVFRMGLSYLAVKVRPLKDESNLENFYINRFGKELYATFFRDYTEKVWGVAPREIDSSWGAQRVKGLSVWKTVTHAVKKAFRPRAKADISQKNTETSLIEYFLYPKLGPGHMWETVAKKVISDGGTISKNKVVTKLHATEGAIRSVDVLDTITGTTETLEGDYFFSTMPISELIPAIEGVEVPEDVDRVARALPYRDFITVGLLLKKLMLRNETDRPTTNNQVPDNWIYIQEPQVKVGRLQVFNNWSPYLVKDPDTVWVGMEYFCNENDELWNKSDEDMGAFGVAELASIGVIDPNDVLDVGVFHIKKTYPAYFGSYAEFDKVREFVDTFENLFLLGRNGQHRYNNQDHSMLTAIEAVENIVAGRTGKANVWGVNVEQEYHEEISDNQNPSGATKIIQDDGTSSTGVAKVEATG